MNGLTVGMVAAGGLFVYGGLTGRSPLQSALMLVQGYPVNSTPVTQPVTGAAAATAPGGGGTLGGKISPHNNRLQGRELAAEAPYHWAYGAQWQALDKLWTKESSWSNTAKNPTSGAYGIPQAWPASKLPAAGLPPTSDPGTQIAWGLAYIKDRYGSPHVAWYGGMFNGQTFASYHGRGDWY